MSDYEVYSLRSQTASLAFSGGELKVKESDSLTGHGIRVLKDGRIGFGYCQSDDQIKSTIEEAERISRFSPKSGFSFSPKSDYPEISLCDPSFENPDYSMLKSYVDDTRAAVEKKGGKARIFSSIESSETVITNSSGLSGGYRKTIFSMYAECLAGEGLGLSYFSSHHPPGDLHEFGSDIAEMAFSMQGAGKPESGTYTIIFEPQAMENIIDTILPSFSGDWKRRKITRLKKEMKFSDLLTVAEDPLAEASDARPFDDEGTPSRKRLLIDKGVMGDFIYDRETAALEGVDESGSCTRASFDTPPAISPSNIVISPGDRKDLGEIGRHIEVHYAQGSHTANITTGDIGLEASGAFLVEKGNRKPIKGFLISGNVFDMLSDIEGIESQQKTYGSLICPRIAFRNLKVVS